MPGYRGKHINAEPNPRRFLLLSAHALRGPARRDPCTRNCSPLLNSMTHMSAYCIVYENIDDTKTFEEYRRQVLPTIEAFQGRFIVRGGTFTTLEGEMPYERIAVLEFPSRAAAESWYHSPDYQRILPLRTRSGRSLFILVDGVAT